MHSRLGPPPPPPVALVLLGMVLVCSCGNIGHKTSWIFRVVVVAILPVDIARGPFSSSPQRTGHAQAESPSSSSVLEKVRALGLPAGTPDNGHQPWRPPTLFLPRSTMTSRPCKPANRVAPMYPASALDHPDAAKSMNGEPLQTMLAS